MRRLTSGQPLSALEVVRTYIFYKVLLAIACTQETLWEKAQSQKSPGDERERTARRNCLFQTRLSYSISKICQPSSSLGAASPCIIPST